MEIRRRMLTKHLLARGTLPDHHVGQAMALADALNTQAGAPASSPLASRDIQDMLAGRRIISEAGAFYRFDGAIWESLHPRQLRSYVSSLDGLPCDNRKGVVQLNAGDISGIYSCLFDIEELQADSFFDGAIPGAALDDCFIAIDRSGGKAKRVSQEHSHLHRARYRLDAVSTSDSPEQFLRFLRTSYGGDADADSKIAALQEFIGLALVGLAHRISDASAIILQGEAASGKSIIIEVVQSLFPSAVVSSQSPDEWEQKGSSNAADFKLYSLSGKALNGNGDMSKLDKWGKTENFKKIITGDLMSVRGSGKNGEDVRIRCAHIFATNHGMDECPDKTDGLFRRIKILEHNRTLGGTSSALDRGPLVESLTSKSERSAIINWGVDGAIRLLNNRERYTTILSSQEAIKKAKQNLGPVDYFLSGVDDLKPVIRKSEHAAVSLKFLFEHYEVWSELAIRQGYFDLPRGEDGRRVRMNLAWFKREIQKRGAEVRTETRDFPQIKKNTLGVFGMEPAMSIADIKKALGCDESIHLIRHAN